jgi:hypothetical protein
MVASAIGTVAGAVVMIIVAGLAPAADRAAALAVGYGVAFLLSTLVLAALLRSRVDPAGHRPMGVIARVVLAGLATYVVMTILTNVAGSTSWVASLVTVVVVGALGVIVYGGLLRVLTNEPVRRLVTIDHG